MDSTDRGAVRISAAVPEWLKAAFARERKVASLGGLFIVAARRRLDPARVVMAKAPTMERAAPIARQALAQSELGLRGFGGCGVNLDQ